jgi:signal transduction histidine kinase
MTPTITPTSTPTSTQTTYRYRSGRVTVGTLYFLLGMAFLLDSVGLFRVSAAVFWPLLLIALGVGMLLRRARRLQVEEDRSGQLAVAEERVRIARELHDIVAHGVSLMTIQIAAARRVANSKPEAADQSLEAAEHAGRQTLSELDSMLAVLRGADASIGAAAWPWPGPGDVPGDRAPAGQPGVVRTNGGPLATRAPLPRLADIPGLVNNLKEAGRTVTLQVLGSPPAVTPSVEVTIYRVVQEALTNAVRYAGDADIDVQLIYAPQAITVFVDDNGPGAAAAGRPGGGHGLVGMYERLTTIGGSLEAGPRRPGPGWRVYATVPVLALVS